ncbi:hypothetical protein [Sphingopyxis sp. FD7]|uniref:hypothetical protein n=1 Tax=Sphingopyxis sp. FD7 TaxID=1914525 RepID=UPI000DC63A1B|nr:hypothetical protein [Sphingopyxis sp. FD7]BBB13924.1 acid phosphatase [Sphingopyxis sp. FD7]
MDNNSSLSLNSVSQFKKGDLQNAFARAASISAGVAVLGFSVVLAVAASTATLPGILGATAIGYVGGELAGKVAKVTYNKLRPKDP